MRQTTVGIIIFHDVEVLDFCGPFEVFSVTRLDPERRREEPSPFHVVLVACSEEPITTSGGMQVIPQATFAHCPPIDVLLVPGGWGTRAAMRDEATLSFICSRAPQATIVASVCTGALLLGKAGVLENLEATTHWAALDLMADLFPKVRVNRVSHVVEQGNVITSAGISAGIDMALAIVARLCGEAVARDTARHMEYAYSESNARRIEL